MPAKRCPVCESEVDDLLICTATDTPKGPRLIRMCDPCWKKFLAGDIDTDQVPDYDGELGE